MMTKSNRTCGLILLLYLGLPFTVSFAVQDCFGQIIFDGSTSDNFNDATNWTPAVFPNTNESYLIQDNRTAVFSSGSTSLGELTVANDSFGRLRMTGGSLTLLNQDAPLEVGRERFPKPKQGDYNNNGIVDAADFTVWRDTLGQAVVNAGDGADGDQSEVIDDGDYEFWKARFGLVTKGGEVVLTGSSVLTTNEAVIGRRSKGLLTVGPQALADIKGPLPFSTEIKSKDLEIGGYGRAYIAITNEPGLEGDGLLVVEGTVNANDLTVNVFGSTGEVRVLPGGKLNLNGALVLSFCDTQFFASGCGLIANPEPLMSAKLTIVGSGGTIGVGKFDATLSPAPGHDPELRRDFRSEFPATATVSFTADAGGVTPIVLADNSAFAGELTGTAYLDGTVGNVPGTYAGMNLQLDLDAYNSSAPLTLIDAPAGHLVGVFGTVTFLGSRTATVNYDYANGDVILSNFQNGGGAVALLTSQVPEPASLTFAALSVWFFAAFSRHRRD